MDIPFLKKGIRNVMKWQHLMEKENLSEKPMPELFGVVLRDDVLSRHIWDYKTLGALVSKVPDDKILLLDLAVDCVISISGIRKLTGNITRLL